MNSEKFKQFLASVDLAKYRTMYQPIKLVEMDLPKNIQLLDSLYEVYWKQQKLLDFEEFYQYYHSTHEPLIEAFREKITMCEDCFGRGLPARMYRTWASIITQIHAAYVAQDVFTGGKLSMSTEMDHNGIDFAIEYKGETINYQVKKETHSREVRIDKKVKSQDVEIIRIEYEVPSPQIFAQPKKLDGTYKLPYLRFTENKTLERLPNGFVVFTAAMFEPKKAAIDSLVRV